MFGFTDETDLGGFYEYSDRSMEYVSKASGFLSAFGYLSLYELARYRYIGITEFSSLESIYDMVEASELTTVLTPPKRILPMTFFADCVNHTYPGHEHRKTGEKSVTLIHPFSISQQTRDSARFEELKNRNQMAINGQAGHVGWRAYSTTNSASIHNFFSVSEWASEEEFLAYRSSREYRAANEGGEDLTKSGYQSLYRVVRAKTIGGFRIDARGTRFSSSG